MEENKLNVDLNKLAYIGDAYFELYTRKKILEKYKDQLDMNELHKINTSLVCAKQQSNYIDYLLNNNLLKEDEIDIFKSARNLHTNTKSKNSPVRDYRKATGFESLIGYLYLNERFKRIDEVLSIVQIP